MGNQDLEEGDRDERIYLKVSLVLGISNIDIMQLNKLKFLA